MHVTRPRVRAIWFLAATVLVVSLGACATIQPVEPPRPGGIEVSSETPVPGGGLRVLAVDFSPKPGSLAMLLHPEDAVLMVAIDNVGAEVKRDIVVEIELWQDGLEGEMLGTQSASVASLSPGEAKVVTFAGMRDLQVAPAYLLKVRVSSNDGQIARVSAERVYRIQLSAQN